MSFLAVLTFDFSSLATNILFCAQRTQTHVLSVLSVGWESKTQGTDWHRLSVLSTLRSPRLLIFLCVSFHLVLFPARPLSGGRHRPQPRATFPDRPAGLLGQRAQPVDPARQPASGGTQPQHLARLGAVPPPKGVPVRGGRAGAALQPPGHLQDRRQVGFLSSSFCVGQHPEMVIACGLWNCYFCWFCLRRRFHQTLR